MLFVAAFLGGALNSVAGGGSFLTLPALLYAGVAPVSANATSTFAMWPASLSSAVAYRREIGQARAWTARLGFISLVGGLLGGLLLVRTSDESFVRLLPWLLLLATVTFTFGGHVAAWTRRRSAARAVPPMTDASVADHVGRDAEASAVQPPLWMLPVQLVIATYGGYFGGGMGIMMMAGMAIAGMTDIHEMNGLKTVLAIAINGVALATFVATGAIAWTPGVVMVAGGVAGGYLGASTARRVSSAQVRWFVIAIAWAMTVYFFIR
jgi:uncharacterized protein